MECQFALRTLAAQPDNTNAPDSRFPLVDVVRGNVSSLCSTNWPHIRRVRGRLTLMLAAAANATATPAPARLHGFMDANLRRAFRSRAHA